MSVNIYDPNPEKPVEAKRKYRFIEEPKKICHKGTKTQRIYFLIVILIVIQKIVRVNRLRRPIKIMITSKSKIRYKHFDRISKKNLAEY